MSRQGQNKLTLVLPCNGAVKFWKVWALAEKEINFRQDHLEAQRCTMSFAALELETFLCKADPGLTITISEQVPGSGRFIELRILPAEKDDGFKLIPQGAGIVVAGHGRKGLLNGAYELLHRRGWRWLEPGPYGEVAPRSKTFNWPDLEVEVIPSFHYRGMDAFRESQDSIYMLLWMARNRLNFWFRKKATAELSDKLGMFSRQGGHLLQRMLSPERCLSNGKKLWDAHPEWYGFSEDGKQRPEKPGKIQLCLSQPSLLVFIGSELLHLLKTDMDGVDIVDVWGFDSWAETCSCEKCVALGNGSDQNLFMLSVVRDYLDQSYSEGKLDRRVLINMAAYESTVTLDAPSRPVPKNLRQAGDMVIYYPIKRCYRHHLQDNSCAINTRYRETLQGWGKCVSGMSLWEGEYYNVSKFVDLPLLFTRLLPSDMRFYYASGARGATYMHFPFVNWAMRALTQIQHAQYAWDINADDQAMLDDYFSHKYEQYADEMQQVYRLIEHGSKDISSWQSYTPGCLVSKLGAWDGSLPSEELKPFHFQSDTEAIAACRYSMACWQEASDRIDLLLERERVRNVSLIPADPYHKPADQRERNAILYYDVLEHRLGENRRLLGYGIDTMKLFLAMLEYYHALYVHDLLMAEKKWREVEHVAATMATYYAPISYELPGSGLVSVDALSRIQLHKCITRCRGVRLHDKLFS